MTGANPFFGVGRAPRVVSGKENALPVFGPNGPFPGDMFITTDTGVVYIAGIDPSLAPTFPWSQRAWSPSNRVEVSRLFPAPVTKGQGVVLLLGGTASVTPIPGLFHGIAIESALAGARARVALQGIALALNGALVTVDGTYVTAGVAGDFSAGSVIVAPGPAFPSTVDGSLMALAVDPALPATLFRVCLQFVTLPSNVIP